jgi:bifunctional non-homologous end joining protein LigD
MSPHHTTGDRLRDYRAKRSADRTPEPFGGSDLSRPRQFVVQQHAARRMHWDLRLEMGGVLRSWAVPHGPATDPAEKRLAVATEDHPLEYADFEGIIPEGNYGAGAMIVWDRGQWISHTDPEEGMAAGKLLFDLKGFKLRGLWTLVRTKRDPKEWLLIKKPDAWATTAQDDPPSAGSVLSGLTVEELASGPRRFEAIEARLGDLGAPRRALDPARAKVMLAQLERHPFTDPDWLFELKYDGYRLLASRRGEAGPGDPFGRLDRGTRIELRYRSGRDATATFPEVHRALSALPFPSIVLDGEIVVLDDAARPSFQLLQQRAQLSRRLDIERASVALPATYFAFDLLGLGDYDLRGVPLGRRKELLRELLPTLGPIRYADHVEERGEAFYEEVRRLGLEGIVAKRIDSVYRGGRSAHWIKIRAERVGDFAVVGYTLPQGGRAGLGALHLGALADGGAGSGGELVYAGRVGSGFADSELDALRRRLEARERPTPPVTGEVPAGEEHRWVEPELVVEVAFTEVTAAGQLRHPVFRRFRDDKSVRDCARDDLPITEPPPPPRLAPDATPERLEVSRPEKVFWPAEGYTKGDLFAYYDAIAPWLLPFLRDRPLVLDRYPDGIEGKSFYQKNAPEFAPEWIRTETIWSGDGERETEYFVCDSAEALLYVANLGAIPLHIWSSRVESLERPDWCILDLDPKEASFTRVVRVAQAIRRLCERIELPCHPKTSGGSGLHVLIPLGGQCTYDQSRQLAELMARLVVRELPELATVTRSLASRGDRVYIDYVQNGHGKLLVAPYSVRPYPGAKVSTPLRWSEVTRSLDPSAFNLKTVPGRVRRQRDRLLEPILTERPDLPRSLELLLQETD